MNDTPSPTPGQVAYEDCPTGKRGYRSKTCAWRALLQVQGLRQERRTRMRLCVYACRSCRLFHLGHRRGMLHISPRRVASQEDTR
jgi:hypothetical protein